MNKIERLGYIEMQIVDLEEKLTALKTAKSGVIMAINLESAEAQEQQNEE